MKRKLPEPSRMIVKLLNNRMERTLPNDAKSPIKVHSTETKAHLTKCWNLREVKQSPFGRHWEIEAFNRYEVHYRTQPLKHLTKSEHTRKPMMDDFRS